MVAHWRRSTRRKRGYRDHRLHRNVAAEARVAWKRYAFLETWRETKAQSLPRTRSQHIDQRVHRTTHYMSCKTGRWVTDACSGAFRCKRDSVTSYDVAKARRNACCGGGGNREETSRGRDTSATQPCSRGRWIYKQRAFSRHHDSGVNYAPWSFDARTNMYVLFWLEAISSTSLVVTSNPSHTGSQCPMPETS